jgi:hypothetical protein
MSYLCTLLLKLYLFGVLGFDDFKEAIMERGSKFSPPLVFHPGWKSKVNWRA